MIRRLHTDDFPGAIHCWNASAPFDPLSPGLFHEKVIDDDGYRPEFGWVDEGEDGIRGFAVGAIRSQGSSIRGFVKFLAVRREYRRLGVASSLLRMLEDRLERAGVVELRPGESAPNYLTPGVDVRYAPATRFFESRGFRIIGEAVNMEVGLCEPIPGTSESPDRPVRSDFDTRQAEEELRSNGISLRRAVNDDAEAVRLLLAGYWPAWIPEIERTFRNDPISLHLAVRRDRVIAFSGYDGNNLGTGSFGPMGTDPDFQSSGLGETLLKRCLVDLHRQGHRRAIIPWVGPVGFYTKTVGATISRVFVRMEKRYSR